MSSAATCESLREPCLELFDQLKANVSDEIAARLKCNRVVQPHGTNTNVLLWRVWDARLPKLGYDQRYSCICLNYDPTHYYNQRSDWLLHLYFNTHRVYRHSTEVRKLMEKRLRHDTPKGFELKASERAVEVLWYFNHSGSPSGLVPKVLPKLVSLAVVLAPVFDELVSLVERPASDAERAKLIASRPRPTSRAATVLKWEGGAIFNRGIPSGLRAKVLAKSGNSCGICRKPLDGEVHIDHIVPVAKGGLTELSNLQATHAGCNLSKGKHHV